MLPSPVKMPFGMDVIRLLYMVLQIKESTWDTIKLALRHVTKRQFELASYTQESWSKIGQRSWGNSSGIEL